MKKLLYTSIVIILVPSLIFIPLCIVISMNAEKNMVDYSKDIMGTWNAFQYYAGKDLIVCDSENSLTLTFDGESISVSGNDTILTNIDNCEYKWNGPVTVTYSIDNKTIELFISFNSHGNLQVKTSDGEYTILLRKSET